ncbi:MAG TPA: hypothetical protein VGL70_14290 [Candidatus Binatia bacterium]|jgi:hypothetical protein
MKNLLAMTYRFGLMAVVVLTAGCSTTATVTTLQPIEGNLDRYKKAVVAVTTSPDVQWRDEAKYVESRLKFGVVEKLKATRKFQEVTDEVRPQSADSDLKIVLNIVSLQSYSGGGYGGPSIGLGVGGGSRGAGGFYGLGMGTPLPAPGSSGGMIVQIELLDARTGKRLGFMDASTTSGDIAKQVEAIGEKVVAEITRK